MSWNNLLNSISGELNEDAPIIKKKPKEKILFEKIAKEVTRDELNEFDMQDVKQKAAEVKQKVGDVAQDVKKKTVDVAQKVKTGAQKGWMALKSKIKEIATVGFRLGVAVGKLFNGKFVLFNKAGKIVTPPADNAKMEKIASGKNVVHLTYKSPAGPMDCAIDDKLANGFGTQKSKSGAGVFYAIAPKTPGLTEGIDYPAGTFLKEGDDDDAEDLKAMADIEEWTWTAFEGKGAEILKSTYEKPKVAPVEVNYRDFKIELEQLLESVKEGTVGKGTAIQTLGIYAPTGWGKSKIIEDMAKENDYHFWPMELAKIDINILAGFPYLDDGEDYDSLGDDVKTDRLQKAKKIVKLASSQFLPPSEHPDKFLLFLDEFNRADTEKMAAVMNLLLTGELGGAANLTKDSEGKASLDRYKLPKKVVVVLAMNTEEQDGVADGFNGVNNLDIATLERVNRIVYGRYHLPSWSSGFAQKPFVWEPESGEKGHSFPTKIPSIIMSYLAKVSSETKGSSKEKHEAPFLLPIEVQKDKGGGGERTASPRSWTQIADRMMSDGYLQWSKLDDEQKNSYENEAKAMMAKAKKGDDKGKMSDDYKDYLFAAWFNSAPNQIKLLSTQSPELGDKGPEEIGKMTRAFMKKAKEGISIEDVLLNYKSVRSILKENVKNLGFGNEAQLLAKAFNELTKYKSPEELEKYMESKSIPLLSKQGITAQLAQTFKAMYKDLDFNPDDFATFTHLVDQKAKSSDSASLIRKLAARMANWDIYLDNLKKKIQTKSQIEKELDKIGGGSKEKDGEEPEESNESNDSFRNFLKGMQL